MRHLVIGVFALSVAASVRPAGSAAAQSEIRAGIVTSNAGESVLAMTGAPLPAGTRLTLITPRQPQTLQFARVVSESPNDGDDVSERTPGPYYEVAGIDGNRPLPELAVAVAVPGNSPASRIGDTFSLWLSAELPDVRARWCASYEGIHFTLWSGEPLKAKRIWHAYYSAGANLRPTCQAADTQEDGGFQGIRTYLPPLPPRPGSGAAGTVSMKSRPAV